MSRPPSDCFISSSYYYYIWPEEKSQEGFWKIFCQKFTRLKAGISFGKKFQQKNPQVSD